MEAKEIKRQRYIGMWTPIIRECKNSGLTVREWCEANEVDEKQFYYWQRRVRENLCTTVSNEISVNNASPTFIEVTDDVTPISQTSDFHPDMVLNYGSYRLEIGNTTSPQLLNEVMKVLNHV